MIFSGPDPLIPRLNAQGITMDEHPKITQDLHEGYVSTYILSNFPFKSTYKDSPNELLFIFLNTVQWLEKKSGSLGN